MELKFVIYTDFSDRQERLKQLVARLEEQGAVQVIHANTRNTEKLAEATGLAVMSVFEAHFKQIDASAIVFVDGDLVTKRLMDRLSAMNKIVYLLVPQDAIPPVGPGNMVKALLDSSAVIPALQGDCAIKHKQPIIKAYRVPQAGNFPLYGILN